MSRRRITIEERGRSVVVRGWRSGDLLEEAGIKAVFSGAVGGWMVASRRLPDLLAFAERRHLAVDGVRSPDLIERTEDVQTPHTLGGEGRTQCGRPLTTNEAGEQGYALNEYPDAEEDVPLFPGGGDAA